jgi:dynein light chain 4
MNEDLRAETVDMVVTAVEKHPGNYEVYSKMSFLSTHIYLNSVASQAASKNIKEAMDKKCGNAWHAVIGEGFDFEITYEMGNIIYMYVGILGILVWKAL